MTLARTVSPRARSVGRFATTTRLPPPRGPRRWPPTPAAACGSWRRLPQRPRSRCCRAGRRPAGGAACTVRNRSPGSWGRPGDTRPTAATGRVEDVWQTGLPARGERRSRIQPNIKPHQSLPPKARAGQSRTHDHRPPPTVLIDHSARNLDHRVGRSEAHASLERHASSPGRGRATPGRCTQLRADHPVGTNDCPSQAAVSRCRAPSRSFPP